MCLKLSGKQGNPDTNVGKKGFSESLEHVRWLFIFVYRIPLIASLHWLQFSILDN